MPKTRSTGNTIASRSNGGGGASISIPGQNEMSDRINERLRQEQRVRIPVESRTRGQIETVDVFFDPQMPGRATVTSASGHTYNVDTEDGTCDCPDYRYRRRRCRHIEAVALAQEQIGEGTFIGAATDSEVNVNEVLREHIQNEEAEERQNIQREFEDDGHFYMENIEEFDRDFERLKTTRVPYEYENVLNGSDITFGIELEFVNGDSNAIARELHELGICGYDRMVQYHAPTIEGKWKLERDGSVTTGNRGGELVSPILRDTPETWRQIEKICEVARRHGAQVNYETGGHVHISVEPLDGKRQRWRRLFKSLSGTEEAMFRFAGGEQGRFRNSHYTRSSVDDLNQLRRMRLPAEGSLRDFRDSFSVRTEKYRSINFKPFASGSKDTVEFRAFNGTLTPGIIQGNIKMAAGFMHSAERARIKGISEGLTTDSFKKRGELIEKTNTNLKDKNAMIKLVDMIFTRKKDKEHILSVMAKNTWR